MAFIKGQSGNVQGRRKGIPNKATIDLKIRLKQMIDGYDMESDIKKLEPKDRIVMMEKFMSYLIPKIRSVDTKINFDDMSKEQVKMIVDEIFKSIEDDGKDND